MHIVRIAAVAIACLVCCPLGGFAADQGSERYAITAWTAEKGVPSGDILAMAQDNEGYLWLGTTAGLVRFDGFEFTPWNRPGQPPLPGNVVAALVGSRDGALWLGFGDSGGIARIRNAQVETFSERSGVPPGPVSVLFEDHAGTMWAGSRRGISMFRSGSWQALGHEDGFPPAEVFSVYEDSHRRLWAGTSAGIFRRNADEMVFELYDGRLKFVRAFAEDSRGAVWVTDLQHVVKRADGGELPGLGPSVQLPAGSSHLLRDRHQNVWVAALGNGLMRLRNGPGGRTVLERFSYENKIVGGARSLFEDAEHNIWVGIRGGGLLRIAETIVSTDIRLSGLTSDGVRALTVSPDGTIWAATGHALNGISTGMQRAFSFSQTTALHTDADGRTWAVAAHGVGRFENGRFRRLPLSRPLRLELVSSMTTDTDGSVWLCSSAEGVLRWHANVVSALDDVPVVARQRCSVVFRDRQGRIWLGFAAGDIALYVDGRFHAFGKTDGLAGDAVQAIHEDKNGLIWVSTASGLSRFKEGRFTTITADNGLPGKIVPSLVDDQRGHLWLGVGSGAAIVRIDPAEMDTVQRDHSHQVRYTLYDVTDGLQGELHWRSRPSAVRGADGRLWFATGNSLAVVDPGQAPIGRRRPPPRIDLITASGRALSPLQALTLPPHVSPLQIDFGALNLSGASKVRFRYMLEGFSLDWVEVGARRQATFVNLPPGSYRFRLNASDGGGWNEAETAWAFSVRPPFYQTAYFYVLCVTAVAMIVWAAWWMRLQAMRRRFSLVMAERARVSREIHDTLLQSLVGVALQFQALSQRSEFQTPSVKQQLLRMRKEVEEHIREARQSICELRSPTLERHDLTAALRHTADQIATTAPVRVDFQIEGTPRRCDHRVEEALLRIGQEALLNAVRHARATQISMLLQYEDRAVVIRVRDNGIGFDGHPAEGHYGLIDMDERAKQVGGRCRIVTEPGRGTQIETVIPVLAGA